MPDANGVPVSWRTNLVAVAAGLAALGAGAPHSAAAQRDYAPDAYGGLAAWVDMYDREPWERPERTMSDLAGRGVETVFVQTSNYRQRRDLHRPAALSRMLAAADRVNVRTVAWYLPGFDRPRRDWHRMRAALDFVAAEGQHFDGFALDIEATVVADIAVRNRRMLRLSDKLRRFAGPDAALGAIIPDPVTQRYWPNFPYRRLRARYDVFLPMAYWTPFASGARRVYRHARGAIEAIRARTCDPSVPIHVIGGIANRASVAEVGGFARASLTFGAVGASLYDAPITSAAQWRQLQTVSGLGEHAPAAPYPSRRCGRPASAGGT